MTSTSADFSIANTSGMVFSIPFILKFITKLLEENSSVSEHILKMSGLHNRMTQLNINLPDEAVIDRILQSLPPSYKSFMMN